MSSYITLQGLFTFMSVVLCLVIVAIVSSTLSARRKAKKRFDELWKRYELEKSIFEITRQKQMHAERFNQFIFDRLFGILERLLSLQNFIFGR